MQVRTVQIKATRKGFTLAQATGDPLTKWVRIGPGMTIAVEEPGGQRLAGTGPTLIINSADPTFTAGLYLPRNLGPCSLALIPTQNGRFIKIPGSSEYYGKKLVPHEEIPDYIPPDGATEIYGIPLGEYDTPPRSDCTPTLQYKIPAS
jgi:hypothetical protein